MNEVLHRTELGGASWEGRVRLPALDTNLPQNEEWFELHDGGSWTRMRFHDYARIYQRKNLYEHLFYGLLSCDSPRRVVGLLDEVLAEVTSEPAPLRVLDLGAGNGIVAEALHERGGAQIVGLDILPEARAAALRDRPDAYTDYLVADLCDAAPDVLARLRAFDANALVCVAALGFGDIPAAAFHQAASLVSTGGMLAFNIKEEFLDERYTHGFSELIRRMVREKVVRVEAMRRYRHRLSAAGTPLFYTALVVTKLAEIPRSMLVDP